MTQQKCFYMNTIYVMKMIKKNVSIQKVYLNKNCNGKIFSTWIIFQNFFLVKKLKTSVGNFFANNTESKGKQLKVSQFAYQSYQLRSIFFLQLAIGLNFVLFFFLQRMFQFTNCRVILFSVFRFFCFLFSVFCYQIEFST